MQIRQDDLSGEKIGNLLRKHLQHMHKITPPESIHALAVGALRSPEITFWSAWEGDELLGCGALKELDLATGEVKSMRTAEVYRGRGVGSKMLEYIIQEAQRRGYTRLYLETGAMIEFAPARTLYLKIRFRALRAFC